MSKVLGKLEFVALLPRRGSSKFPVSLTLEMYAASIPDGDPVLVLTIPNWRGIEEEINWYTPQTLRADLAQGIIRNKIAVVDYEVDSALLGIWLDSTLLGL